MTPRPPIEPDSPQIDHPDGPAIRWRRLASIAFFLLCAVALVVVLLDQRKSPPASMPSAGVSSHDEPASPLPAATATTAQPEPTSSTPVEVQVMKPIRRDIAHTIALPANIAPLYQTTLYAKVAGYLKWIGPDKGDWVKKGQVLAVIDAPEVEEQYHQAVADFKIKKLTHERLAKVWKESPDVIAKQDVDVAQAAFEGSRHLMEQRQVLRDYTNVRAPYDGLITARFADPGALIQIATTSATSAMPLFTIMDINTVRVYANVPQDEVALAKVGTPAGLTVSELPGRLFQGAITRSTLALDPATRTMLIEVDLPNKDHLLQPGTFGELTLTLAQHHNALALPPTALVAGAKAKTIVVVEQGRSKSVPVKVGLNDGKWIEIVEGLHGDEDVVVVGKSKVVDGMQVQTAPYNLPEGKPSAQKFERRTAGPTPPASAPSQSLRPGPSPEKGQQP
jgi:RND family efflux transporter MFP subunit